MKRSEIKEFFYLYDKIDKLAEEIFNKFEEANLLSAYISVPHYERIEFNNCDSNLVIRYYDYGYDIYEYRTIEIPFDVIYNNKVDEYIENLKNERQAKLDAQKQMLEKERLEKEKAEYERLKAKYENP